MGDTDIVSHEAVEKTFKRAGSASEAVDRLCVLFEASVKALRDELKIYLDGGPPPSEADRFAGAFAYPALRIIYQPDGAVPPVSRAFSRATSRSSKSRDLDPVGAPLRTTTP